VSDPSERRPPWWAPPQRLDARAVQVLKLLGGLSLVVGYHGTLLSQTMTFAADEFGVGTRTEGTVLAVARLGGVLAVVLTTLADRRGRRRMLLAALLVCIGSTVLGAVTPNLAGLTVTQVVNRGGWAASFVLLGVIVAEEMPSGARAYAISLLGASTAIGAGAALVVLPLADLAEWGWRLLYAVPLLMAPLVVWCCRHLPESRRYTRRHEQVSMAGHGGRLWLLAIAGLLLNVFIAPQTQLRNDYLQDERGLSAAAISLFVILVSAPGGIGLVVGGRLADTVGRRYVGAFAVVVGTALLAVSFMVGGVLMWAAATVGSIVFAAHAPSVLVYGPELFPTSLRGRANGIISITAMAGSVVGLVVASRLADDLGSYAWAMAAVAAGPLLMGILILARFPETARQELEDLNPEDRLDPTDAARSE
jgi:MFS family permease